MAGQGERGPKDRWTGYRHNKAHGAPLEENCRKTGSAEHSPASPELDAARIDRYTKAVRRSSGAGIPHPPMNFRRFLLLLACACAGSALADPATTAQLDTEIARHPLDGPIRSTIGVTRGDTPIPCFLDPADLDPATPKIRVLLVGGLDGKINSVRGTLDGMSGFLKNAAARDTFALSCVPRALPEAQGHPEVTGQTFPPTGTAYNEPGSDAAHYLWRWIGMHAPDLVIVVSEESASAKSLIEALAKSPPCEMGTIPAVSMAPDAIAGDSIARALAPYRDLKASPAHQELQRRVARPPVEVAAELGKVYGRKLDPVMYIPALAIVGRMRLGELTGDPQPLKDAEALGEPYRTGTKDSMGKNGNGSTLSGHLVFAELAHRTGDAGWTALAKKAADYGFDESGKPKASMPFHSEMSDSIFMGCATLAEAASLTEDKKYVEQCLRHLRFMQQRCLRPDGIYRHSPLDEAAWGRGNGFPALGMALSLSALPEKSEAFAAFLESYRSHLAALRKHQDPTGAWHQVIDHPESYREFTSTCMITFAIVRGMRRGWLDSAEWQPVVDKSWRAVKSRIGHDGHLVDVCTGTGKMMSPRDYYDRTATLGRDDRGGAMALMVATEMAFWEKETRGR